MKKVLLSLLLIFGSLNMFAQDNGWKKSTSPITGESWIIKQPVTEMGDPGTETIKIWKNPSGSHSWNISYPYGKTTDLYSEARIEVKVGGEWKLWYKGRVRESMSFSGCIGGLEAIKNGTYLKIERMGDVNYVDLKGSSNALKSL